MAISFNLQADQGSTFEAIIDLKDMGGLPLDVAGQNFRGQFRKSYSSLTATTFSCSVLNSSSGQIMISLSASITKTIKPGRYVYDIEMYDLTQQDTDNVVTRVLEGQIEFTPAASSFSG